MLFNLQGAHRFQRRAFILPQRFFFVKHFFQVFSNSFVPSFADLVAEVCRPRGQPNYITTFVFPCQALFSSFFKLFRAFSGRTFVVALPSQTAFRGYHCRNHLSSTFFKFFELFRAGQTSFLLKPAAPDLLIRQKRRNSQPVPSCVGVTYLPGPSPDKYFRQKRA